MEPGREEKARRILTGSGEAREAEDLGCVTLLDGGVMHQLNLMGGEIWKRCDGTRGRREIVAELLGLFEAEEGELAADVDGFLEEMLRRNLIREEGGG